MSNKKNTICIKRLEGAGVWTTLCKIVLPACKRALIMLALICLSETWNLLEQPMALIKTPARYPLSVYLATASLAQPLRRFAACVAALLPVLLLYLLLARAFLPSKAEKK